MLWNMFCLTCSWKRAPRPFSDFLGGRTGVCGEEKGPPDIDSLHDSCILNG